MRGGISALLTLSFAWTWGCGVTASSSSSTMASDPVVRARARADDDAEATAAIGDVDAMFASVPGACTRSIDPYAVCPVSRFLPAASRYQRRWHDSVDPRGIGAFDWWMPKTRVLPVLSVPKMSAETLAIQVAADCRFQCSVSARAGWEYELRTTLLACEGPLAREDPGIVCQNLATTASPTSPLVRQDLLGSCARSCEEHRDAVALQARWAARVPIDASEVFACGESCGRICDALSDTEETCTCDEICAQTRKK